MLSVRYCGRDFTVGDIEDIRAIWLKFDGGLKAMSCSVALRRMAADGWIDLPPPLCRGPSPAKPPVPPAASGPQPALEGVRGDLGPLEFRRVRQPKESRLWHELITRSNGQTPTMARRRARWCRGSR